MLVCVLSDYIGKGSVKFLLQVTMCTEVVGGEAGVMLLAMLCIDVPSRVCCSKIGLGVCDKLTNNRRARQVPTFLHSCRYIDTCA